MIRHSGEHIHMIGIGGAGMSPIAEQLLALGYTVTGSDRQRAASSIRLETLGIRIQYDHVPALVKESSLVVYSSAVKENNEERMFAASNNIRQIRRAEILGDLMRMQTTVCIAGTHGKTTTTSMAGALLQKAQCDPTVLIGGMLRVHGTHAIIGKGKLMVAEADEFDRSFLAMNPTVAVVTNIDEDHLDCYKSLDAIKEAFLAFLAKIPFYGTAIVCTDDPGVQAVVPEIAAKMITYGTDGQAADYRADNIRYENGCAVFEVFEKNEQKGTVSLAVPGMHNIRNALAAIAVARLFDVDFAIIREALGEFGGVHRRFEVRAVVNRITIIDDYAHHPREIHATIEAAQKVCRGKIIAVFQPHLYTRTRDFMDEFAKELCGAACIIVTDIYKAREEPIEGIHASTITDRCVGRGHTGAQYISSKDEILSQLGVTAHPDDYVIFMGAGDINQTADRYVEVLRGKA